MKFTFLVLFMSISSVVFGKNSMVEDRSVRFEENITENFKKNKTDIEDTKIQVSYEYYYTMDWLYSETPFTHKLDAYV